MILRRDSTQQVATTWMRGLLLAVSLLLAWPAFLVSAQQQEGTPLRVPPGVELRATLDGKTEKVSVQAGTERNDVTKRKEYPGASPDFVL